MAWYHTIYEMLTQIYNKIKRNINYLLMKNRSFLRNFTCDTKHHIIYIYDDDEYVYCNEV